MLTKGKSRSLSPGAKRAGISRDSLRAAVWYTVAKVCHFE
jgi:hypothetical protein